MAKKRKRSQRTDPPATAAVVPESLEEASPPAENSRCSNTMEEACDEPFDESHAENSNVPSGSRGATFLSQISSEPDSKLENDDKRVRFAAYRGSHTYPPWQSLNWKPVTKLASTAGKTGATIVFPFGDVEDGDIPGIIQCFGGAEKILPAVKHPKDKNRKLSFSLIDGGAASFGVQPYRLSTKLCDNQFLISMDLSAVGETPEAKRARARKEQSAVERSVGLPLAPLPSVISGISFLFPIKVTFEFDKLCDFGIAPAIPVDRTSANPSRVELTSIVPYLVPSFPSAVPPGDPNDYYYFPPRKFSTRTRTGGHEGIPSLYKNTVEALERTVVRARKTHARAAKWVEGGTFDPPRTADPEAKRNMTEKVPVAVIERAKQLLKEQPIWLRHRFYAELAKSVVVMKEHKRFIVPGLMYKCSGGPWSHSWCKLSYNPTKHVDARDSQLIDFRINRALFLPKQTVAKKAKVPKERDLVVKEIVAKIRSLGAVTAEVAACGFQLVLRLKELADVAEIRRILESPDYQTKTCTFSEGFFREGTMEAIRLALSRAILREDPALAGSSAGLVRQFQRVGLFKGVVLAAKSGEEEEENDWENEGEEDGRLSTADGDAEMEDRTGPLGADGEAVDVEMDLEEEGEMGEEEE